jgi:hypothetical protein
MPPKTTYCRLRVLWHSRSACEMIRIGIIALGLSACGRYGNDNREEARYRTCEKRTDVRAYVEMDTSGSVLVCAFAESPNMLTVRAFPRLLKVGDTLFAGAVLVQPDFQGDHPTIPAFMRVPYEVYYGPLSPGSTLRITNRYPSGLGYPAPLLDTVVTFSPTGVPLRGTR